MKTEVLIAITSIASAAIGGSIAILGNMVLERIRRRTELNRLISQKRIEAYEKLLARIEYFGLGMTDASDYSTERYPMLFEQPQKLSDWRIQHMSMQALTAHLFDARIGLELHFLDEYIMRLEGLIDQCKIEDDKYDMDRIQSIGILLYPDFKTLKTRIVKEIHRFFSNDVYQNKYRSYILDSDVIKTLPPYFMRLNLIAEKAKLIEILKRDRQ